MQGQNQISVHEVLSNFHKRLLINRAEHYTIWQGPARTPAQTLLFCLPLQMLMSDGWSGHPSLQRALIAAWPMAQTNGYFEVVDRSEWVWNFEHCCHYQLSQTSGYSCQLSTEPTPKKCSGFHTNPQDSQMCHFPPSWGQSSFEFVWCARDPRSGHPAHDGI